MKKNIKILIIGGAQEDPTSIAVINSLVKKAIERKQSISVGQDMIASFLSVDPNQNIVKDEMDYIDSEIELKRLSGCFKEYPSGRKLWNDTNYRLPKTLEQKLKHQKYYQKFSEEDKKLLLLHESDSLKRRQVTQELYELQNTLKQHIIPYFEAHPSPYSKESHAKINIDLFPTDDKQRKIAYEELVKEFILPHWYCYQMSKVYHVLNKIIDDTQNSHQLVVIFTNYEYLTSLTAYFYSVLSKIMKKEYSIKILPIKVKSHYFNEKDNAKLVQEEKDLFDIAHEEVKAFYKEFQVESICFVEDVLTKEFNSKTFDEIVENLFATEVLITSFTEKREALIKGLGGKVKTKYDNNEALIEIDHLKLNKENREKLGLCSKYLKFEGDLSQPHMDYIKNISGVTTHKTRKENTLWVTFPKKISEIVREAYQNPKNHKQKCAEEVNLKSTLTSLQNILTQNNKQNLEIIK